MSETDILDVENFDVNDIDFPFSITLKFPLKFGQEEISEVVIKERLKARHLKGIALQNMTFNDSLRIISRLVALPMKCVEELDANDLMRLNKVVEGFLESIG